MKREEGRDKMRRVTKTRNEMRRGEKSGGEKRREIWLKLRTSEGANGRREIKARGR
jgi:hypothetical protein